MMAKWTSDKYKSHFEKMLSAYAKVFAKLVSAYDGLTINFTYTVSSNVKPKEPNL